MMRRIAAALDAVLESVVGVVVLFIVTLIYLYVSARNWHPAVEFYSIVAQVVPVLLLAAAVEGRYFRQRPRMTALDWVAKRAFLLMAVLGEACALGVVARQRDSQLLRAGTFLGLFVVGAAFVFFALDGPEPPDDDRPRSDDAAV